MTECKHDWQFVDGITARLRCTRCAALTGPKDPETRTEELLMPTTGLGIGYFKPDYNITFHNNTDTSGTGRQVGRFDFNGPQLVFEGDADESAKVFVEWVATYFSQRLEEERAKELEACCNLLEGMHAATDGNHNYYLYAAKELRKLRGKT